MKYSAIVLMINAAAALATPWRNEAHSLHTAVSHSINAFSAQSFNFTISPSPFPG